MPSELQVPVETPDGSPFRIGIVILQSVVVYHVDHGADDRRGVGGDS